MSFEFPPLRTGLDVVEVERFRRLVGADARTGASWLFTEQERAYALRHRDPVPRLAVRFAAKEAVLKVIDGLSPFSVDWQSIEVIATVGGRPGIRLLGEAAEAATEAGLDDIAISLTHSREIAMACAVAVVRR